MINGERLVAAIAELVQLTNARAVHWTGGDMTVWKCQHRDMEILVWWYQDDKPSIHIGGGHIQGYEFGIQELLNTIRAQQSAIEDAPAFEARRAVEQETNAAKLNRAVEQLLKKA